MIFYLLDLFFNNICIYTFAIILFFVGKYEQKELIFILFIDMFINGIPIIFLCVFILNYLNKWIKLKFVNGFVLNNLLFIFNYILFFFMMYIYKNNSFNINELLSFYVLNFLINYILFFIIKKFSKFKIKKLI